MKTKLKIGRRNWQAVVGNHPKLQFRSEGDRRSHRAYFPHVVIPRDDGRDFNDTLCINTGGGEMTQHDARAILIAAAPALWWAARNFVTHANTAAAHQRFQRILRAMERQYVTAQVEENRRQAEAHHARQFPRRTAPVTPGIEVKRRPARTLAEVCR